MGEVIDANRRILDNKWSEVNLLTVTDEQIKEMYEDFAREGKGIILHIPATLDSVTSFFKVFKCRKCGNCCREIKGGKGIVLILESEIKRLTRQLNTNRKKFVRKYCVRENGKIFMRYPCPFLKNNKCSIYTIRPLVCRQYPLIPSVKFTNLDPAVDGIKMLTVSSVCPEARHIAFILTAAQRELSKDLVDKPGLAAKLNTISVRKWDTAMIEQMWEQEATK